MACAVLEIDQEGDVTDDLTVGTFDDSSGGYFTLGDAACTDETAATENRAGHDGGTDTDDHAVFQDDGLHDFGWGQGIVEEDA